MGQEIKYNRFSEPLGMQFRSNLSASPPIRRIIRAALIRPMGYGFRDAHFGLDTDEVFIRVAGGHLREKPSVAKADFQAERGLASSGRFLIDHASLCRPRLGHHCAGGSASFLCLPLGKGLLNGEAVIATVAAAGGLSAHRWGGLLHQSQAKRRAEPARFAEPDRCRTCTC